MPAKNLKVREVMSRNPATACVDSTVEEIATIMKEEGVGAIPILDDEGCLAGMITEHDIVVRCIAEGRDPSDWRAEDILIMKPELDTALQAVNMESDIAEAARIMALQHVSRLPVVEEGKLLGVMSFADQESVAVLAEKRSEMKMKNKGMGTKNSKSLANERNRGADVDPRRRTASSQELKSDSSPGKQGITNRNAGQENARQDKVVPMRQDNQIRNERVAPPRKKAS
ncbi:MAG: hypothetical protein JWO13_2539 [Acidobacteriales bacterium]|nr:hypothetical protein [Terriglobales bacterium]